MISIITICFNNLDDLLETIGSVNFQSVQDFEHLIIDGSTNDKIRVYLESNPQPATRRWICEPDRGIGDAFNKGIEKSKGDIIVLLNSGDCFYDANVIEHVYNEFNVNSTITWLHGMFEIKRAGREIIIGKSFDKSLLYRGMRRVCHQTMYVKKELYLKYGGYDINEKVCMDYDFLCRISNESFKYTTQVLAKYDANGISNQAYLKAIKDAKRAYLKYFPYTLKIDLWILRQTLLFKLINSIFGKFLFKIKDRLGLANW
jgi:glycosyltransferase involved in cell wall biosynthesis